MVRPLETAITPANCRTTCELSSAMRIASSSDSGRTASAGSGLATVGGGGVGWHVHVRQRRWVAIADVPLLALDQREDAVVVFDPFGGFAAAPSDANASIAAAAHRQRQISERPARQRLAADGARLDREIGSKRLCQIAYL